MKTTHQSLSWTRTLTSLVWLVKMNWYVMAGIRNNSISWPWEQILPYSLQFFDVRTWARLLRLTGGRRKEMLQRFKNQESTYSWPLFENQPQSQHWQRYLLKTQFLFSRSWSSLPGANPSQLWLCHRASVLRPCSPTFWTVQHASKGSPEVREIGLLFFSFQTNVKPGQQRKYQYAWVHLVGLLASIARSTPTTQNFSKAFPLLPAMDSRSFLTNLFF